MEKYRVIIIAEADRMTAEAANSLLKMLEEPPNYTYLILCTAHINALLPTIVSRCQRCRFGFLPTPRSKKRLIDSHGLSSAEAQKIARIAQGSFRRALDWLQEDLRNSVRMPSICCAVALKIRWRNCNWSKHSPRAMIKAHSGRLGLILLWLRDALMVKIESPATKANLPITNFDQLDTLQKFVGAFDEIDIPQCLIEVETAIEQIDRNANLTLVIMALMHRLSPIFSSNNMYLRPRVLFWMGEVKIMQFCDSAAKR
jgi:DNA polymerase-3 subunit delta'